MSSSNGLSSTATHEEKSAQIARALAWLKAEQNAADSPPDTSLLLHESAVILEGSRDDAEAAKNYRAAMSFNPDFREPLERLIALAERHHSYAELGPLYQQLAAAADNTNERSRANLEWAFFLVERGKDTQQALQLLGEIVADTPDNAVAWLLLALAAERLGDATTRERALEAQLNLTELPHYRALLLMEWSELREAAGDSDRSLELLDLAAAEASSATYPSLLRREFVALRANRQLDYLKTLEQRIRLLERALVDAQSGDALGVLRHHRSATAIASFQILAGLAHAQLGDTSRADACLANARGILPDDRFATAIAWITAERCADWPQYLELGEVLAKDAAGASAAWIWQRLAVVHWQRGDNSNARQCINQGLRGDPHSIALRTFDVHLALQKKDGLHLASAIEAATDCFDSESEKANWLLAAAGVWAVLVRDASGTKAAVAQAGMHGLDPSMAHQASRLLARWSGDLRFYDDSTRIAQQSATAPLERIDLLLELLRIRQQRQDFPRALEVVAQIAANDATPVLSALVESTLGNCLRQKALANPPPSSQRSGEAHRTSIDRPYQMDWTRLAPHASSPEMRRALQLAATISWLFANQFDRAKAELDGLADQDPSDVVVATARSAIALRSGDSRAAARILRQAAECTQNADLRACLAIEGALLAIQSRHVEDLPQLLDLAGLTHPHAVAALSRWVLRRVSDEDLGLAQRVIDASHVLGAPQRRALEQLGLALARGEWHESLPSIVSDSATPPGALDIAVLLTHGIAIGQVPETSQIPQTLVAAQAGVAYFEQIERAAPIASNIDGTKNRRPDHATATDPNDTLTAEDRLSAARTWANSDPSLVAQLEWLLASRFAKETFEEADAREQVARHLGERDADALRASAQLQRFLIATPSLALLPSTSAAARLANLEMSPPGCDPRRRATALEEAGELLGAGSAASMRGALGFNQLASGATDIARSTFSELVETHPRYIPAWLGLRLIAERTSNRPLLAQASAALGDLLSDPKQAAAEWERAADILLDELADGQRGRKALERAIALDITREGAFSRLFRLVRDARQNEQLLELIANRLPHSSAKDEAIMLHWERARSMRALGDREGALTALDAVGKLDPNHVGALALAGEIHIALGHYDDAARYLAQLARQADAPIKQRLMGGLAAADLFDKKLSRPAFAKDILLALHREGHSTAPLRERLSALAIRTHAYPLAVELLAVLMEERDTTEGRAEAARIALALYRDQLQTPAMATPAVTRLLIELPGDEEAIDLVLTGCFDPIVSERWLRQAESLLRQNLMDTPLEAAKLERLARIAQWFADARTRQVCLGALITVGAGTMELDVELSDLDARVAHVPAMAIDDAALSAICDPDDHGPMAALFQDFAAVFADALGPTLSVLGVTKKQRVEPRSGLPLRNEIVAWAGAFGIKEFDLYLAERVEGDAIAIPNERPSLVVTSNLTAPLNARGRQAIVRELLALRRGTCLLRHRSMTELTALIVATCQVGGHPLDAPSYAMQEEFVREVSSAMPRRLRKLLSERCEAIRQHCGTDTTIASFIRAAISSHDRAAALAAGDVSHVLSHLTGQRGRPPTTNELIERTSRLLSFALSFQYLDLKDRLGLSVR